jgi:hypothetical protein
MPFLMDSWADLMRCGHYEVQLCIASAIVADDIPTIRRTQAGRKIWWSKRREWNTTDYIGDRKGVTEIVTSIRDATLSSQTW